MNPARRKPVGPTLVAVAVAIGVFWCLDAKAASRANPDDAAQVALGKTVYAANCAQCHGAQLEGQPDWRVRKPDGKLPAPPHDYHGHTWHHPDEELFRIVKQGVAALAPPGYKTDMAGFGGVLSDAEIWAVLAYIKSAWPEEFRKYQAELTKRAEGH